MSPQRPVDKPQGTLVRVAIPHFFCEGTYEGSHGYGSGRSGNRLPRSLALARCLGSVLALNRARRDFILNLAEKQLELSPSFSLPGIPNTLVELHLFVCKDYWLEDVVQQFAHRLQLHQLDLEDPRQLPLAAVRQLLDMPSPANLSLYLEDDLVINDMHFAEKMIWFQEKTDHRFILMPHRREPSVANAPQHLYVDGPTKCSDQTEPVWASDESALARVRFWDGLEVDFARASNPHSGSFCLSRPQLNYLCSAPWPPESFVGPLETAATGTVLRHFPILKPTWDFRDFLTIEHGNPSFLSFLNEFQLREDE